MKWAEAARCVRRPRPVLHPSAFILHPLIRRSTVRAAVDVMGGDKAPAAILQGCWEAAALLDRDDRIFLVGDEGVIRDGLAASGLDAAQKERYEIVATTDVIGMDDAPVEAIR